MIVVADTSPIHYFILLEIPEILKNLYGRVIIPEAVAHELNAQKAPEFVSRWIAQPPPWLEVRQIVVPADLKLTKLDPGEREAIALAEALRADALLIDERAGRREAERRRIRVIGTIRILDDAADAGFVNLVGALGRLKTFGFFLDEKLERFLLERQSKREGG